jgi:hypothetical protein
MSSLWGGGGGNGFRTDIYTVDLGSRCIFCIFPYCIVLYSLPVYTRLQSTVPGTYRFCEKIY